MSISEALNEAPYTIFVQFCARHLPPPFPTFLTNSQKPDNYCGLSNLGGNGNGNGGGTVFGQQ